jgi:hypothetical protein
MPVNWAALETSILQRDKTFSGGFHPAGKKFQQSAGAWRQFLPRRCNFLHDQRYT